MKQICRLVLTPPVLLIALFIRAQAPVMEINENGTYQPDLTVALQELSADIKVVGNIATTTIRMRFFNRSNRLKEGRLTFPLPEGVSVSGFALDINGVMRKAVPVEKARATAAFESIERRQVDPGILEKTEGNNFRTRIYPINPNGARTVAITYNQELHSSNGRLVYDLPLANKTIGSFSLMASVYETAEQPQLPETPDGSFVFEKKGNVWRASIHKSDFTPGQSLKIIFPRQEAAPKTLVKRKDADSWYFLTNVSITPPPPVSKQLQQLTILWDNSLSGLKRDHKKEKAFLEKLFVTKSNINVTLYTVATTTKKIGDYTVSKGATGALLKAVDDITYDGATDYSTIPPALAGEVLFFTDGLSNFGEWSRLPGKPVSAVVATPVANYSKLQYYCNSTGGQLINLNAASAEDAATRLVNRPYRFLGVKYLYDITSVNPGAAVVSGDHLLITGIARKLPVTITLQFGYGNIVEKEIPVTLDDRQIAGDWAIETFWAQQQLAQLEPFYDQHKETIARLGKEFGIVTPNTSLIVLENVADYVKYKITPPTELLPEYKALVKQQKLQQESNYLEVARRRMAALKQWWNTSYPVKASERKFKAPRAMVTDRVSYEARSAPVQEDHRTRTITGADLKDLPVANISELLQGRVQGVSVSAAALKKEETIIVGYAAPKGTVRAIDIKSDAAYMKDMDAAISVAAAHKTYLQLRKQYETTPSFYFDMANWFYARNATGQAVSILSNLVELELEDATLYKTVGYLLKRYGQYHKELIITKKVLDWRPMDPQSYRDYALALQDNGKYQQALDTLYAALTQTYTEEAMNRDSGIEEVLLMEINNIVSRHNARVNIAEIDKDLLYRMPVDIRVVLNWNMDHVDMDLHITDPKNEECYYGNKETSLGGRISNDFTDGFGPEQFLLKKAMKGKYRIKTNFFGERQVTAAGPPTLMAEVFLRYASGNEERKIVVFQDVKGRRAANADGQVLVAEFDF
ncbi:tetratricopeptide (TPR) repeat protein [Niabella hirudinis]